MTKPKLRVLQLFEEYLPITENWAYRLLAHTPGVDLSVFAKRYLKNDFYHPDFHFVAQPVGHLWQANQLLDRSRWYDWLLKLGLRGLQSVGPQYTDVLDRHLRQANYGVVHAHFANLAWDFHRVVARRQLPYVLSFYGWDYEKLPYVQPAFQQYFQQLFRQCAAIICEGPHGAQTLIDRGCPAEKIAIVHLGIDCAGIPFFQRQKRENSLRLLQIAAFSSTKGFLTAIRAFALALPDCPGMEYVIIGVEREPGHRQAILDLIRDLGLEGRVRVRPKIDYRVLHRELQHHHVFIHPSQYAADRDCEGGAPIILLDAQATGLPIIATTHCDIPNEVAHGETGLLSPEGEVEALAAHIRQFYAMGQVAYDQWSHRARQKMEREFDIYQSGQQLAQLYQRLSRSTGRF